MHSKDEHSITLIGRKYVNEFGNAFLNIFSLGVVYILCRISIECEILLKTRACSLEEANCVILKDQYANKKLVRITNKTVKPTFSLKRYIKDKSMRYLDLPYGRFIYDYQLDKFILPNFNFNIKSFEEIYNEKMRMSNNEESINYYEKQLLFGANVLSLGIPSVLEVFLKNLIEPFFIWELFSFITWIAIKYHKYAFCVGPIYLIMLLANLIDDFRNRNTLLKSLKTSHVRALREGSFRKIREHDILPGDILYIDTTDNFNCDVEILKGNVITDESFLTGESVPICKGVCSIVYSGTKVIKSTSTSVSLNNPRLEGLVRVKSLTKKHGFAECELVNSPVSTFEESAIGIVLKTGNRTRRNTLMSFLSTKKMPNNTFIKQSEIVVKYLISGAVFLMTGFIIYFLPKLSLSTNIEYSIDVALTFFSPALYTCLQLGAQHARGQLLKKKINTTDVSRINTAGEVDMIVFDKTGTLTELGVDILCFDTIKKSIESIEEIDNISRMALSTCHYVLELDNQYSGDILDMKMFMFSQSKIINKDTKRFIEMEVMNKYQPICKEYTGKEDDCTLFFDTENNSSTSNTDIYPEDTLEVLKIYDFDLYLKRISVVVKTHENKMYLFCKGAPDSVSKILKNVPENYAEKVRDYGLEGYRVLTVGYKEIAEYGNREADEAGLEFLGFLVFANKLKKETEEVIKELREAELNPKMCTGDNILTAISVARECGMIDNTMPVLFPVLEEGCKSIYDVEWFCVADEDYVFDKWKMLLYSGFDRETTFDFIIACEGKEFEYMKNTCYEKLIFEKGVVFARFNPDNKKDLIEEYSKNGHVTMFCGDGANDTGALCSADVGVSLATNEASLAASFNSRNLSSVLDVIKEGRSALSMSAAQFKYIFYSQVLAGFQMVVLLPFNIFPSDGMSLVNDLMSCYILGYALSNFKAAKRISKQRISSNLYFDCLAILAELSSVLIVFFTSVIFFFPENISKDTIVSSSKKSTAIFFSTMLLLILRVIRFANFGPFRASRLSSHKFLLCVSACLSLFITVLVLFLTGNKHIKTFYNFVDLEETEITVLFITMLFSVALSFLPYSNILKNTFKEISNKENNEVAFNRLEAK
ncbi:hypothetical protein GINT2_000968 [Glugoides intestinalis]